MAPSLASTVASAVFFSVAVKAQSYSLSETYDSSNFLEKFDFFVVRVDAACLHAPTRGQAPS